MPLLAGSASFQRFFIVGRAVEQLDDRFFDALTKRTFGKSPPLSDLTQIGWIGSRHLFDTEPAPDTVAFGRFAHLALRVDRLKAPPAIVRSYIRIEEQSLLAAGGREQLSRTERRKAREAALARAEAEQKSGDFRRIAAYPVLVDLDRRCVYLGNTGTATAERLMLLFAETFGGALEPADPAHLALRLLGSGRTAALLDRVTPARFAEPPDGFAEPDGAAGAADLSFLGKELLTWLWYHSDRDEGPLALRTSGQVAVLIDRTLRLRCDFGLTGTTTITADSPALLAESRAALRIGKQPTRMGLILGGPWGEARLTLDGPRLLISGLTLPEPQTTRTARERIEERFELIADLAEIVDAIFELFLTQRLGPDWPQQRDAIAAWATGRVTARRLRTAQ